MSPKTKIDWNDPEVIKLLRSKTMAVDIAKQLGVSESHISHKRRELGVVVDQADSRVSKVKWKDPEVIALLRSEATNVELAERLGVSLGRVSLKRKELGLPPGQGFAPKVRWADPAVLDLLKSGKTNSQIAKELGIDVSRVQRKRTSLGLESPSQSKKPRRAFLITADLEALEWFSSLSSVQRGNYLERAYKQNLKAKQGKRK